MRKLALFLVVLSLCASAMSAQVSGDARTFSLEECLKIAMEKSYEIQNAQAQYQTQAVYVTQNFGAYLPALSTNMGYSRLLNSTNTFNIGGQVITLPNTSPNSYNMSATASYLLFNGFSREANYQRAQRELEAAELNLRRVRQSVAYNIRSQYLAVLKAMQISKIRQENVELGKKEVERARALFEAGRTSVGAVYSQEADLGTREIELITAQNAENQAKAQLLSTMALPPDSRSEFLESSYSANLEEQTIAEFRRETGAYSTAIQTALSGRLDFKAIGSQIQAAESGVSSAKGNYYPAINASGGWQSSSSNTFGENGRYFVGMNLNLPIFDNLSTSTAVQIANIQLAQREIDRSLASQKIRTEVQSAFLNMEAAEKQFEVSKRAVKSASQNFDATKERFAVGAATLLEYQSANNQLVNAKINRVNVVYSYFDAQAQVRFALGTLSEN